MEASGFDAWALSLVVFLPLVGAIVMMAIPKAEEELHKVIEPGDTGGQTTLSQRQCQRSCHPIGARLAMKWLANGINFLGMTGGTGNYREDCLALL